MKKRTLFFVLTLVLLICFTACNTQNLHIHKYGEWTVVKDATTTEEGQKVRYCSCGDEDVEIIPVKTPEAYPIYVRDGNYIYFGEYPQTIKADNVTITDTTDSRGYYLGSDGCYYAKLKATPCTSYYTFTTGEVIDGGNVYYFKVEPIRWRILSEENGEAFLLCDSIIANQRFDEKSNNYAESEIRAWLNNTFYDTAFGELEKALILTTEVDNSAKSANPHDDSNYWNNGVNRYVCENTRDRVFLLSEEEVTNSAYGFEMYTSDKGRVMATSDYSRAIGAMMNDDGIGWWWLRSPSYEGSQIARGNIDDGQVQRISVYTPREGVVPAIRIML